MGRVQRSPVGILQLLGIKGVDALPDDFAKVVVPQFDVVQFYGQQQLTQFSLANAALAEGGTIDFTVPADQYWVYFSGSCLIAKTATMTALRGAILIAGVAHVSEELGPFGATETGAVRVVYPGYFPRILGPGTQIRFVLEILGTDATANCFFSISVGVLG